jgi:hypothetical protein
MRRRIDVDPCDMQTSRDLDTSSHFTVFINDVNKVMHDLSAPGIAYRVSLRFESDGLPTRDNFLEATSTLVLNGGGDSALFTDFRPFRNSPGSCDWAFAGAKTRLPDGRFRWTHDIDSRRRSRDSKEDAPDVGACEVLPNGDEMERGVMLNPATGRAERYEELWRPETVELGSRVRVIAQRDPDASDLRGVFVQVARWAQVVAEYGAGEVGAQRWMQGDDGQWMLSDRYGHLQAVPTPDGLDAHEGWVTIEDYIWTGSSA